MAGVTDLPFRVLCKEKGASLVYTEMVSAKAMHYKDKNLEIARTHPDEMPIGVQIFGHEPISWRRQRPGSQTAQYRPYRH